MTDYTKTTNFTAKDSLTTGDPNKLVVGADFDTEFDNLATHIATKEDSANKSSASGYAGLDGSSLVNDAELPSASATVRGVAELATDAEVNTGTDTARIVTPAGLAQATSLLQGTTSQRGALELATDAEVNTGTDTARAITPASLAQATSLLQATDSQRGAVELATQAEVDAGTDTARVITPATLASADLSVVAKGAGARGALAYGSANQSIGGSGVEVTVTFDSEAYDTDSVHSTSVNTSRLTVPAGVTKVRLKAGVQWAANADSGYRRLRILKNGSTVTGIDDNRGAYIPNVTEANGGLGIVNGQTIDTGVVETAAGDYFELTCTQNAGTINILADQYWFEMEILA
jgi:hypothetical protein